jgi:hypothetical protein
MKLAKRKKLAKEWYDNIRYNSVCMICGEGHPATLEFHHREPELKVASISKMVKEGMPLKTIFDEAAKCDILCANDHKKIHCQWKQEREFDRQ